MKPFAPPRFVLRTAWAVHRSIARRGPGRGLWEPGERNSWGALTLTATGRRSGQPRSAIVAFLPDGDRLHLLAMNGWQEGHPEWWLNLRTHPDATITRSDGTTSEIRAHQATGAERERLWQAWLDDQPRLKELASHRRTPTDVVVLAPRSADEPG